jgi:ATP-dependent DNA ligase
MAAMKAGDGIRLISRNGIQHTKRFSELVQALDSLSTKAFLLDGGRRIRPGAHLAL